MGTQEDVNTVCTKLVTFYLMDNEEKSAQVFAEWVLESMDLFWQGKISDALMTYLTIDKLTEEPRQAVKSLRVLHEVTTHCTNADLKRLVLNTGLLGILNDILDAPKVRGLIVRSTLTLISNIVVGGWRLRDAIEDSGLLSAMVKLMYHQYNDISRHKTMMSQLVWLLYQFLMCKMPGPSEKAVARIARTVANHLNPNQDVTILIPLLKLARLISEYQSVMLSSMIQSKLLARSAPFVRSPVVEVKREAIFILANTCQQHKKRQKHALYRFPKSIILYIHGLFLYGPVEIRVLVHQLLGGIIDNRCIRTGMMLGLIPKVIFCASMQEQEEQVRSAASWTLVSFAMHLEPRNWPLLMETKGYHVMCEILHRQNVPVQLTRNILCVFLRIMENYRVLKPFLVSLLYQCNVWDLLVDYAEGVNSAVRTLATLLCYHRNRDVCWIDVLA
ncbi:uncharacterized isoform X1 [Drosophila bipectinata]|uniref:Alpha-karyopherin 5 n=1 Tax=Drosophila parabipectinata TaxID=186283 RepID=G9LQY1_9MUSC|nr:uncharacterized LOC108126697 [Drosophila bipectinata]AEW68219.1 alpha-karyopherin 5 [Drosophila parabipectinata]